MLAGVVLFAAFLPGPSDVGRFPAPADAAHRREIFHTARLAVIAAEETWLVARCDPIYKPLKELQVQSEWCRHGEACWGTAADAGAWRLQTRLKEAQGISWLRLAELWNLLGPLNYAAGRMPEPPRRNRLGHYVFD